MRILVDGQLIALLTVRRGGQFPFKFNKCGRQYRLPQVREVNQGDRPSQMARRSDNANIAAVQLKIKQLFLPPSLPHHQYCLLHYLALIPFITTQHKPNNTYTHTTQLSYSHTTQASFLTQLAPRESERESHAKQTGRLFSHHNNNNPITTTTSTAACHLIMQIGINGFYFEYFDFECTNHDNKIIFLRLQCYFNWCQRPNSIACCFM